MRRRGWGRLEEEEGAWRRKEGDWGDGCVRKYDDCDGSVIERQKAREEGLLVAEEEEGERGARGGADAAALDDGGERGR